MSKQTRQVFQEALRSHMADEHEGAMMTDYVLVASGVSLQDGDPATEYLFDSSDGAPHAILGLAHLAHENQTARFYEYSVEDEEE